MQTPKNSALIGLLDRVGRVTFIHIANCINLQKALSKHYHTLEKVQNLLNTGDLKTVGVITGRAQKSALPTVTAPPRTVPYTDFWTGAGHKDICELYLFATFWHKKLGTDIQPFTVFA